MVLTIESTCLPQIWPGSKGSYNCDSDKQISRTFQGFFKDKLQFSRTKDLFHKLEVCNLLLSTLLAKTLNGVIYDFYFFSHGWSHYFILLSEKTLCKMTAYDLQMNLRYRNSISNKETEIKHCISTKMLLPYPWILQVLT